jgi:hypothetical protein
MSELQRKAASEFLTKLNKKRALPPGEASFNALYGSYAWEAKERGIGFYLTKDEFRVLTKQCCVYCGQEPLRSYHANECVGEYLFNGVDRVDNGKDYIIDNCVASCKTCNYWKRDMTVEEFLSHVKRIGEKCGQDSKVNVAELHCN